MLNACSKAMLTQSAWIPNPTLTESNLPAQTGKVHIVTGGYAGVGEKLVGILYDAGAKVYVAGRNKSKAEESIERNKAAWPNPKVKGGQLIFLFLDLSDLTTVKPAAEEFMSKEDRLDVLTNNAGVMFPPKGTKTVQNHDLQFGTNCLGPYLFTKLLHPILKRTAASSPPNSVRVTWASSVGIQVVAPPGGVQLDSAGKIKDIDQQANYGQTKVGNNLLAIKTQEILKDAGVVSVAWNPGNLWTELQRHSPSIGQWLGKKLLYPAKLGAYTELYAGWSEDITIEKGISYIMPWGRDGTHLVRSDIVQGIEKEDLAGRFWQYCEEETKDYA